MFLLLFIMFIAIYTFIKLYSIFGNSKYDSNNTNNFNKDTETKMKTAIEALMNASSAQNKNALTVIHPIQIVDPKLSEEVMKVKEIIPEFVPEIFLKNAEQTFDTVFDAFINCKHHVLKDLLEEHLYNSFADQIKRREDKNLRQEIDIIHQQTSLSDIRVSYKSIQLLVIMNVRQMAAMVDINGQSLDNPNRLYRNVQHKWVFETSILVKDNNTNNNEEDEKQKWIVTQTSSSVVN